MKPKRFIKEVIYLSINFGSYEIYSINFNFRSINAEIRMTCLVPLNNLTFIIQIYYLAN